MGEDPPTLSARLKAGLKAPGIPLYLMMVVGIIVAVFAVWQLALSADQQNKSSVSGAQLSATPLPQTRPSAPPNENYAQAVNEANQQNYEDNKRTGKTGVAILNAKEEPLTAKQAVPVKPALQTQNQGPVKPVQLTSQAENSQIDKGRWRQAVMAQLQAIAERQARVPKGAEIAYAPSAAASAAGQGKQQSANGQTTNQAQKRQLFAPGEFIYARTLIEANSDIPSQQVLVELFSEQPECQSRKSVIPSNAAVQGQTRPQGCLAIGSFSRVGTQGLAIRFKELCLQDGRCVGVEAFAVDASSAQALVVSSVDQHYLERILLPAATAFIQGFGQAISSNGNNISIDLGNGTIVQNKDLSTRQQLLVGAGAAADQLAQILGGATPIQPTIILDAGASLAVVFVRGVEL
jgi:Bacterial conjugation TrbI-like protein